MASNSLLPATAIGCGVKSRAANRCSAWVTSISGRSTCVVM